MMMMDSDKEEIDELILKTRNSLIEYGQLKEPEQPDQTEILKLEVI